ncbi:MAG: hypothetical protein H0T62_13855 [Parachlamydiaceae bacterium]|nr:hypothetical protein [Parachlamydiaceae bacterium]
MNFNVDPNLRQSVEQFSWEEQGAISLSLEKGVIDALVCEIAEKIIGASDLRPKLELMANRSFSLKEVCYLVHQNQAGELSNRIQQVTLIEKHIVRDVFEKLSENFIQVEPADLKAITLLFGIKRISEIAAKNNIMPEQPTLTQIEALSNTLAELTLLRSKYDINSVPESQRVFLMQLDAQIHEKGELLEALRLSTVL